MRLYRITLSPYRDSRRSQALTILADQHVIEDREHVFSLRGRPIAWVPARIVIAVEPQ